MQIYSYDKLLIAAGASPYRLGTHGFWFAKKSDGSYDTSHVDVKTIDALIAKYGAETFPLLVDIEAWDFEEDRAIVAEQLPIVLQRWRVGSTRPIGLYAHVPERSWFIPVNWAADVPTGKESTARSSMWGWRDRNSRNAADFLGLFDFVCPSIYAFYPDQWANWRVYAEGNIDEAVRVAQGKPVWPIIYPHYPDEAAIDNQNWAMMVDWVAGHPRVGALMIFAASELNWRDSIVERLRGA